MYPTVFGVGIVGGERAKLPNGKYIDSYRRWQNMLQRCYDKKFHDRCPTYKDIYVCDEWLVYSNFKKWYKDNYYEISGERMHLDKDILVKGNKVYSPETCVFTPEKINTLFTKRKRDRGNLPIGVSLCKNTGRYRSICNFMGRGYKLGRFNSIELAFQAYKNFKEKCIKQIADEYKDRIPKRLYDALYKYEVEITD